jgi:DNA-directed RNA polymerase beta' subunit
MSPEEIRNGSVVEVTTRDTYSNNVPVPGGLFDPRMGVIESGIVCPTDGHTYMKTPGYFGHIELAKPVFYIQYLPTVIKILRCVCYKCSKLLISKEEHKHLQALPGYERWNEVFKLASGKMRCGECTHDGCGCKQPKKIAKTDMATVTAEWTGISDDSGESSNVSINITPEHAHQILRRISDKDVEFMGFSANWARPEWMICQAMVVPPPAVRPSVKQGSGQRSEDDLTHILVDIIKTNNTIKEKIAKDENSTVIAGWVAVLQYYVATIIDNNISGMLQVTQRSGRPMKSIKERLNGKTGRVRGNLMGKRVDYSSRSVITPDPNLSIRELGVPMKIAKNLTRPITVNDRNKAMLTRLVANGADTYPGAKVIDRSTGEKISLRYIDRGNIVLQNGDVVHRHMLDGDVVLFNRQPTLHRMSMMGHIARIMHKGDTFRMNVADTKPYNADFDGDEMNMHLPQDDEAEMELAYLAAVPYQLVSPASNKTIVGIFQDSLLGSYQFTRESIDFTPREAMNIMMLCKNIDVNKIPTSGGKGKKRKRITNFEILSQIVPAMSIKYKLTDKEMDAGEYKTSNKVLDIKNGKYLRGQLDKKSLGGGGRGLLQRVCNDYGNFAASDFIDSLQNVVTEYMKVSAFSVGISDLIADEKTNEKIATAIQSQKAQVEDLIDQVHLGIMENSTGKTNAIEFETKVNGILNKATNEAGKIGKDSLVAGNRFVTMVNAGSKGSEINISQMISCLGQQNVDGKRIPYGYKGRTLPHFTKYDDSPAARGFVESSFVGGLSPTELFFHAQGGREGLIDTAVKTSQTGYISRRLIKSLEDAVVRYDMTVRNNKGKIIQFAYGEDHMDTVKVESQVLPLLDMSITEVFAHYTVNDSLVTYTKAAKTRANKQKGSYETTIQERIEAAVKARDEIVKHVFGNTDDQRVHLPVAFEHTINNVVGQLGIRSNHKTDITPMEVLELTDAGLARIFANKHLEKNALFVATYDFHLAPANLLEKHRFNRKGVMMLVDTIVAAHMRAVVAPGETVGIIGAQSVGEPTTQMSLHADERIRLMRRHCETNGCEQMTVSIGEFCDSIIQKKPHQTFNTGHPDSVETLLGGDECEYFVVGVDGKEKTAWNLISHVSKHPVNGDMMKVTTRSGRTVRTTTSHSHLIRRNQTVEPITGADMKVGMRIPVCKQIYTPFECGTVKIGDTMYELDAALGWFIGAYLAEGSINYHTIGISNISEYYREQTSVVAAVFGKSSTYNEHDGEYGRSGTSSFAHKELANFIRDTCGVGSYNKHVPEFAFTAPHPFKSALVQGYFDGDGNIHCDSKHHQIRASSRSDELIKDMCQMLTEFGIFATMHTDKKEMFNLNVSAKYARAYKECIGSVLHSDKLDVLIVYEERDNDHARPDIVEKVNGLGDIIASCGKTLELPGQSRNYGRWSKKESIGVRTLQKYIAEFQNHPSADRVAEEINTLKQAADADVVWDEVVDIEIYRPDQDEYVYDFTVPNTQTFMVDNGIIVHNTLNTFHFAGVASKSNVTRGVPRIEEILSLTENPKNPSCEIALHANEQHDNANVKRLIPMIENVSLTDLVNETEICFDPDEMNTLIEVDRDLIAQYKEFQHMIAECNGLDGDVATTTPSSRSKWIMRLAMNETAMVESNVTMDDVYMAIKDKYGDGISCVYADHNADKLIFRIRTDVLSKAPPGGAQPLDQSDEIYRLKKFQETMLSKVVLRGVDKIRKATPRKIMSALTYDADNGKHVTKERWVIDTVGTNLMDLLAMDMIDAARTMTNDIQEVFKVLGVEAARQVILNELRDVIEFDGGYIDSHHMGLLCDRMTCNKSMVAVFRHGINGDNIGPLAKASFEETPEMFFRAARHGELDNMRGLSANVMTGQEGFFGTGAFSVVMDMERMISLKKEVVVKKETTIEEDFANIGQGADDTMDGCGVSQIGITNNASVLASAGDMGAVDDAYDAGF